MLLLKIYLIRHSESEDDDIDAYGGISDFPLNEKGRKDAELGAEKLKDVKFDVIFTSPYLRAKQTAQKIAEKCGCTFVEVYNLRERNSYGVVSGVTKDLAKKVFPWITERIAWMKKQGTKPGYSNETLPGAENYLEFVVRVKEGLKEVLRSDKELVGVVSHGGVCHCIGKEVLGTEIKLPQTEFRILEGSNLEDLRLVQ